MTFDFAEVFTVAARRAVPSVLAKKLLFSFDCTGANVAIDGGAAALQRACHRMFLAVVAALGSGFVTLTATADPVGAGRIRLRIRSGGIGKLELSAVEPKLRADLGLPPLRSADPSWRARGYWPDIDGQIDLHGDPANGMLLTLETEVKGRWESSTEKVSADGARAWLVNVNPVMGASWLRRFTRMGWAVSQFDSYAAACAQLAGQPESARPSIVVVVESGNPITDGTASLPELFPRWTRLIYAVPAGSTSLRHPRSVPGYEVNAFPFSPMQLEQFVSEMESQDAPSGQTLPMPMESGQVDQKVQVLLVDDSPVNLIVGQAMLESLGYRVFTATDGQHALDACRTRSAPALVLMDVDMPRMDGIEATQSLRAMQRRGEIPPFQIVGFTAAWTESLHRQCLDAGMDECLPKPLEPDVTSSAPGRDDGLTPCVRHRTEVFAAAEYRRGHHRSPDHAYEPSPRWLVMSATMLDSVNRAWYAAPGSVAGMAMQQGFTDEGERAAYGQLVDEMRHRRILDLGVGPGRTVPLLRSISEDYVGIDYMAPMVEAARARCPGADIRVGDARDLDEFSNGCRDLVVFSYHGIDSVSHDDRQRVLEEAWRVLDPGGVFWFSTLNVVGPAARYRPWRLLIESRRLPASGRWLSWSVSLAKGLLRIPLHTLRYWRGMAMAEAGADWAVAPFFAGGWLLVTHFVSLRELQRELADVGFEADPQVFDDAHGRRLCAADDLRGVFGFNVLARKPPVV